MRHSRDKILAEQRREDGWLRALESGAYTMAELMAITGLSRNRLYERTKQARLRRAADDVKPEASAQPVADDDLPIMHVTEDRDRIRAGRDWYELDSDASSRDRGIVEIVDGHGQKLRVRNLAGGRHAEPGGPTRYDPDDGLKGGVE